MTCLACVSERKREPHLVIAELTVFADKSIFAGPSELLCKGDVVNGFQACTVGGNSAINAGLYFQPPDSDWDLYNPAGWKSADVAAATKRLLARQPSVTHYSQDGKLYEQSGYEAAKKWLVDGAGFSDITINDQPNNKDDVFGRPAYNYIKGQRGGPTKTYLQSALQRPHFRMQTGAKVTSIDHVNGLATGVTALIDGVSVKISLTSKGRVVLSGGALLSPGLLMHSGIGPKETLTKLAAASKISSDSSTWVNNKAVGEGLFDNPNTFIELTGPSIESFTHSYEAPTSADRDLYLSSRSGPYSFASQTSVFWGWVRSKDGDMVGCQGTIDSAGYSDFTKNNTVTLNIYGTSGMLSTGNVVLSDDGKFTPGPGQGVYYSNPRDGFSIATFIHKIFQALPASHPSQPAREGLTPMNIPQNSTVEEIEKYITTPSAYAAGQVNHWSSSCRVGSCVDANTQVIGTKNIHVVDTSILPPLTVNPQFGAMVAGEKGAEVILALMDGKAPKKGLFSALKSA